jgi:hypothetical protein
MPFCTLSKPRVRRSSANGFIQAAEHETWKYIPAIKSHIAEEITLDRCVQRLRKRLVKESREKRTRVSSTCEKMGERVPSFFTSPSLDNLGGFGVSDQPTSIECLDEYEPPLVNKGFPTMVPAIDLNSSWSGVALQGNSTGNLQRSSSDASGLFIDEKKPKPHQRSRIRENAPTCHPRRRSRRVFPKSK